MKCNWLSFLVISMIYIACNPTSEELPENDDQVIIAAKPNILWLVAEDLGPYIPSFGDSTIVTPVLSRLAAEGVRYTNVYSISGVCAPSRAALATGMYPNHIGAHQMRNGNWYRPAKGQPFKDVTKNQFFPADIEPYEALPPAETKMHAEYLRREGYYCTNNAKQDYQFVAPVTAFDENSRSAHWRNRQPGQPFFAIFNFEVTHESRIWAKAEDSLWIDPELEVQVPPYLPDNEVGRTDVRRMYSNIKEMDAQVGEIISQLEEDGLLDSTIIVWYTDHGGPLPRMKRCLYDSGLKVPMIIRFPGAQRAGEIDDQLISFIDFKPTLLSLAGIKPPKYIDGQAFLGEYKADTPRNYIHAAADRFDAKRDMMRAVRDERYKYIRYFKLNQPYYLPVAYREQMPIMQELLKMRDEGTLNEVQAQWFRDTKEEEELFDTETDPHEINNLAGNEEYQEILERLRNECNRWMEAIDDQGLMAEKELVKTILNENNERNQTAPPKLEETESRLSISSDTEGASIGFQYVERGDEPTDLWQVYTQPIEKKAGKDLLVVAHRIGFIQSDIQRFPIE